MYVDLEMFNQEKERYLSNISQIKNSNYDADILQIKLNEEETKYKNSIRKYLSASINKVNEIANGQFSLYKIGKDLDVNFKVIEGKIRKGKQEIIDEFNSMQNLVLNLDQKNKKLTLIAMNVIIDYSDDIIVNKDREIYLNN